MIAGDSDNAAGPKRIREELAAELPGTVGAPTLAAAALRRSDLLDEYPADFPARLVSLDDDGEESVAAGLIADAEAEAGIELVSAADVYFALVFISPGFAKEFAVERPPSTAFERLCAAFTDRLGHAAKETWDQGAAPMPTPRDRIKFPILATALDANKAEFASLCMTNCYRRKQFAPSPEDKESYRRFYLPIRHTFEATHGIVLEEYWGANVAIGVARTAGGRSGIRVHFDGDYDKSLADLFIRCKEINRNGRRFLPPTEYRTLAGNLYDLFAELVSAVDQAARGTTDAAAKKAAAKEVDQAPFLRRVKAFEAELDAGSAREGQRWYILGTVVGLLLIGGVFTAAAAIASGNWTAIFEGSIFGAAGALASVFFRVGSGKLEVDSQQGKFLIGVSALVKPLIGAIFGGIVVALLLSGLPQVSVPDADPKRFFFLSALAFIAGFSERFAPNLLQLTGERVAAEATPKDPATKSAEDG